MMYTGYFFLLASLLLGKSYSNHHSHPCTYLLQLQYLFILTNNYMYFACLVTRLSTGLPVNIETQSEDIYTQLSEPSIQSQAYNSFLMGLMCQQNLESTSCQQRTICLSTGDVYSKSLSTDYVSL